MLHTLIPRPLTAEQGAESTTFMLALLTAVHFDRTRARGLGWRGVRSCASGQSAWTCRVAGSDHVLGLLFQEERQVEVDGQAALEGLFSLHVFPPSSSPLLDSFPLEALRQALEGEYQHQVREFAASDALCRAFYCGELRVVLLLDGQGLGLELAGQARRRVIALDGVSVVDAAGQSQWIIPPGELECDIPAFRLLLPFFSTLAASVEHVLLRPVRLGLEHSAQAQYGYTSAGDMRPASGKKGTLLCLSARWGTFAPAAGGRELCRLPLSRRFQCGEAADKPVLHVLTGFLGSGKTTFLREWLEYLHGKDRYTGVLQNEFGAVGLDAFLLRHDAMVESLDEGCVCCSLAESLRPGLLRLMDALPAREFILETTGLANPANVRQALAELGDVVRPGLVITVVDATSLAEHSTAGQGEEAAGIRRAQIEDAHVLILNKLDAIAPQLLPSLHERLRAINGKALLLESRWGRIPFAELDMCLDSMEMGGAPAAVPLLRTMAEMRHLTHADEGFASVVWPLEKSLSRSTLEDMVNGAGAHRIKGIVDIDGQGWHVVQYVPGRLDMDPVEEQGLERGFLVVIGKNVPASPPHGH